MSVIFMALVIFYFVFASKFLVLNFTITRVTLFFLQIFYFPKLACPHSSL